MGLHYNFYRYYDPNCGRFITQDPIKLQGGNNFYQFAPNTQGWVDPLGLRYRIRVPRGDRRVENLDNLNVPIKSILESFGFYFPRIVCIKVMCQSTKCFYRKKETNMCYSACEYKDETAYYQTVPIAYRIDRDTLPPNCYCDKIDIVD